MREFQNEALLTTKHNLHFIVGAWYRCFPSEDTRSVVQISCQQSDIYIECFPPAVRICEVEQRHKAFATVFYFIFFNYLWLYRCYCCTVYCFHQVSTAHSLLVNEPISCRVSWGRCSVLHRDPIFPVGKLVVKNPMVKIVPPPVAYLVYNGNTVSW